MKKGVLYASIVAVILAMVGCSKYKVASFVMPSWDTQLSAPIFDRTYSLGEILQKDSLLVSNGDTTLINTYPSTGLYYVQRTQEIQGIPVGTNLSMGAIPLTPMTQGLSSFSINSPDSIDYSIPYPGGVTKGQTAPVPAIPPTTENNLGPQAPFANYTSATISNGLLHVRISNGYPATVYFSNGAVNILDANGGPLPIPIDSLSANSTYDTTLQLAGRVLTNNPTLSFTYSSNGSGTAQTYQSDNLLSFNMGFTTLQVSQANAIIPSQSPVVLQQSLPLSEQDQISSATISSGSISLSLTNNFNMAVYPVTLVINSLDSQNVPFTRQLSLSAAGTPGSSYTETINLSGFTLNMSDAYGNPTDSLKFTVSVGIPGSQGQFVNVDVSNTIESSFSTSDLMFSSFTGIIHPKNTFTFASDTQKVDLGDFKSKFSGGITLLGDSTHLRFRIRSHGFPYFVHVSLTPMNSSLPNMASADSADTSIVIYPDQDNVVGLGARFAAALNSFAINYGKIPDEFIISGYAKVNPVAADVPFAFTPQTQPGTLNDTDKINITNTITLPMQVGILNAAFRDTTSKPVFDSTASARMGDVDSARVSFDVNNGLPMSVFIRASLLDTLTGAVTPLDSLSIPAADVNQDGSLRFPTFQHNPLVLTGTQAKSFAGSRMIFLFQFFTPLGNPIGSQPVPFTKTNTISLKVYGNFAFKVGKDLAGK
jgi:hypothetical protein